MQKLLETHGLNSAQNLGNADLKNLYYLFENYYNHGVSSERRKLKEQQQKYEKIEKELKKRKSLAAQ